MGKKCLKCGYERQASDISSDYECPKCGAIYAKVESALGVKQANKTDLTDNTNTKPKKTGPLRYGLILGAMGFVGAFIWGIWSVTQSLASSSTAALGYLVVPVVSLIIAIPLFVLGYCLYYIVEFFKSPGKKRLLRFTLALSVSLALLIPFSFWVDNGLTLSRVVDEIDNLKAEEIEIFLEKSDYGENQYVLEAVVSRGDIDADLLHKIATIKSPELHERPHGFFYPFRERSKNKREWVKRTDFAVMRVIAMHPNVGVRTLLVLADSPNDYVLGAIASNNKTPPDVLARLLKKGGQSVYWGWASNPNPPPAILHELSLMGDEYTRAAVAENDNTPEDAIRTLAQDKEELVRMRLTFNPNVPAAILCWLNQDKSQLVRDHVESRIEKDIYPLCDRSEPITDPIAYLNDPIAYRKNCPPSRSDMVKKWCGRD